MISLPVALKVLLPLALSHFPWVLLIVTLHGTLLNQGSVCVCACVRVCVPYNNIEKKWWHGWTHTKGITISAWWKHVKVLPHTYIYVLYIYILSVCEKENPSLSVKAGSYIHAHTRTHTPKRLTTCNAAWFSAPTLVHLHSRELDSSRSAGMHSYTPLKVHSRPTAVAGLWRHTLCRVRHHLRASTDTFMKND